MIDSFRNIFAIPDLRKRLLFTFALLAVYRLGCQIPTPGVDAIALQTFMNANAGSLFGFLGTFTGGALERMTIFAMGIMPYITSSIILQLLTVVWPYLEKLSKEGEMGRRKITQYTRYGTVAVSIFQSATLALWLQSLNAADGQPLVPDESRGLPFVLMTILTLTTGCAFVMWLGEQISERGIGNGISLVIFAGIVVGLIPAIGNTFLRIKSGSMQPIVLVLLVPFMLAVVAFIVYMERAQRRIPVQYAKRVVGRKVYGGQSTYLPLRVNTGGVIPVIFASSILTLPSMLGQMTQNDWLRQIIDYISYGKPLYYLLTVAGIVFFSYFYVSIIFNPADLAENMRKHGGFIPGIRPGKRTAEHIDRILSRITLIGALYLSAISLIPSFLLSGFDVAYIPWLGPKLETIVPQWISTGLGVPFYFGGTSLLIVVGVCMDFVQQVESQLVMRNYEGFMKRGRIKGRRG